MTHVSSKLYADDVSLLLTHRAKISGRRICGINWRNLWTMTRNYVVNSLRMALGSHFYLVPSRWPFAIDIQRVFRTVSLHPQPRVVYDYRGKMTHVSSKLYAVDTNPFFWKSAQSTLSFSKFLTHTHKAKISGQRICWINWRNLWTMTRNYVVNNLRIALGSQFYLVPSRWPFTISFSSFSLL
ncbi:uncharacterized protein LOC130998852 isoform X3 [Salvia miltiorrhiza]|nr:uncharacterized protein LOC130998852 isoform X3 [Salvia miltiorrhiza]